MELTSSVLRDVEFRETWKGYNQADVDTFIDEVALGVDAQDVLNDRDFGDVFPVEIGVRW